MTSNRILYASLALLLLAQGCGHFRRSTEETASTASKYRTREKTYRRGDSQDPGPARVEKGALESKIPALQASPPSSFESSEYSVVAYRLKPGDTVFVYLRGIPNEDKIEDIVDESGYISVPFISRVRAGGRTASELERTIRNSYLDNRIYKEITVNVVVPSRGYFVRGEVRSPGRFPLISGVTIVQAIATAGGYSEFANPSKVRILRAGKSITVDVQDLERHPEKDVEVEADDVILVPRSIF